MTRTTRFHYPGKPAPCLLYTLTCARCGKQRKSSARPGSKYAPKICAECHNLDQSVLMCKFLNRKRSTKENR